MYVPLQNCSLLRGIRILSDSLENGSYFLGSRFAPSVCRSIVSETNRDILWGKADQEVEDILKRHSRKLLGGELQIRAVKLVWEGDDGLEESPAPNTVRRTNVRAIYLFGQEKDAANSLGGAEKVIMNRFCKLEKSGPDGCYLVCKEISRDDWDRLMVHISVKSLPIQTGEQKITE